MVLIADDVVKDDNIRNYKWVAQIARDLEWDSERIHLENENYQYDIILREPAQTRDRILFIRILECANADSLRVPAYIHPQLRRLF